MHAGSSQGGDKLIVVPYRPKRKLWILLLLVFGYLFVAFSAYLGGQAVALQHGESTLDRAQQEEQRIRLMRAEKHALQEQVAIHRQHVVMEQQALRIVKKENKYLQERISELEEQVAYYQRVVTPDASDKGLLLGQLELEKTVEASTYQFSLHIVQVSGVGRVAGYVDLTILGTEAGQKREYSLHELNAKVKTKGIRVGFRNFQALMDVIKLPERFQPQQVAVEANLLEGKRVKLRRLYDWRIKESVVDVEKTEKK